jgi:hypothetical protein
MSDFLRPVNAARAGYFKFVEISRKNFPVFFDNGQTNRILTRKAPPGLQWWNKNNQMRMHFRRLSLKASFFL